MLRPVGLRSCRMICKCVHIQKRLAASPSSAQRGRVSPPSRVGSPRRSARRMSSWTRVSRGGLGAGRPRRVPRPRGGGDRGAGMGDGRQLQQLSARHPLAAADPLVWLDYPFRVVIWRLFLRTVSRGVRREELWNGNRESLRTHFLTRDSLFLWAKNTHWKHRRDYPRVFASSEMAHVRVVRLRSTGQAGAAGGERGAPRDVTQARGRGGVTRRARWCYGPLAEGFGASTSCGGTGRRPSSVHSRKRAWSIAGGSCR